MGMLKMKEYDYSRYVKNKTIKITPIHLMKYPPHYECTAELYQQSECAYFKQEIGGEDGCCEHSAGSGYVYCMRQKIR